MYLLGFLIALSLTLRFAAPSKASHDNDKDIEAWTKPSLFLGTLSMDSS
jgi:hypothetical protein